MFFAQRRNLLTTHFSEVISVVNRRMTVLIPFPPDVLNIQIFPVQ